MRLTRGLLSPCSSPRPQCPHSPQQEKPRFPGRRNLLIREQEGGQLCQDLLWPRGEKPFMLPRRSGEGLITAPHQPGVVGAAWLQQTPLSSRAGPGRKHSVPEPLQLGAVRMRVLGATTTLLLSKKASA